jgi:hypothetical protein
MNNGDWALEVKNPARTIYFTQDQDGSILAGMADDVIVGRVRPSSDMLWAFAQRRDLPLDSVYRLAKTFPECHELASRLCRRPDATADMLDEWAGDRSLQLALAINPNTRQGTIDRLTLSADHTDVGYCQLLSRVSLLLLEGLVSADANSAIKYFASDRTVQPELLRRLAFDADVAVRRNVVRNQYTHPAVISEMVDRDEDIHVLVAAAERSTDESVLDRLADRLCELKVQPLKEAILRNRHASDAAKAVASMINVD